MITSATPGATIFYTTDGSAPTLASAVHSGPIPIVTSKTIRAIASASGFAVSPLASGAYVITVPNGQAFPVTFGPATSVRANAVDVVLSPSKPSKVCFTLDGSLPECIYEPCVGATAECGGTAATYVPGSTIPVDAPTGGGAVTVKARSRVPQVEDEVTQAVYGFRVAMPTATPGASAVAAGTNVVFRTETQGTATSPVDLRRNTDGSSPTCSASQATATNTSEVTVSIAQSATYRVIACRQSYQVSPVASFAYTVTN